MLKKFFYDDLARVSRSKITLKFNKPAYVGMCILDLSKV